MSPNPGLASVCLLSCAISPAPRKPTVRSLTIPVPVHSWPYRQEPLESDHPAHGEGSDESPHFLGIGASGAMTNSTAQFQSLTSEFGISEGFFADLFKPRPKLMLRVQPQTKVVTRQVLPRRTVGSRSGR